MKTSRIAFCSAVLLAIVLAGFSAGVGAPEANQTANAPAQKQKVAPALRKFMQAKLGASNQVLEGLVTENFELIGQGAAKLRQMSQAEQWRVSNDALYRQYSNQFERVAEQLGKQAEKQNLDGASLAWMEAVTNCIECHKHSRTLLITAE